MNSNLESVQYSNDFAISATLKGASRLKLYKQLGIDYFKVQRTFNLLSSFHKLIFTGLPFSIFN